VLIEMLAAGTKAATDFGQHVTGALKPGQVGQDYQVDWATVYADSFGSSDSVTGL